MSEIDVASLSQREAPLRDSVNSMRAEVHLTKSPAVPADEVWAAEFHDPDLKGPVWTRDWLVSELDLLTWQEGERVPYVLEFRQVDFNWGASASGYSVILQVAELVGAGIAGSTAYEGFKSLIRLMRSRIDAAGSPCDDSR